MWQGGLPRVAVLAAPDGPARPARSGRGRAGRDRQRGRAVPGVRAGPVSAAGAAGLARLRRRGFWLEYASMAWMTAEAAVAVTAGVLASSIALVGFGLDSVIEFLAAAAVIWELRGQREDRQARAVKFIGITFF